MHDDFHFPTTHPISSNPDGIRIRIESTTTVKLSVGIDEIRSVRVRSSTSPRCFPLSPSPFPTISIFPSTSVTLPLTFRTVARGGRLISSDRTYRRSRRTYHPQGGIIICLYQHRCLFSCSCSYSSKSCSSSICTRDRQQTGRQCSKRAHIAICVLHCLRPRRLGRAAVERLVPLSIIHIIVHCSL